MNEQEYTAQRPIPRSSSMHNAYVPYSPLSTQQRGNHNLRHRHIIRRNTSAAALSAVLLAATWGATTPTALAQSSDATLSGTVTFWTRISAADTPLLKGFSKAYPNIHLKITPEPSVGEAQEKLGVAIRAGTQPDLVDLNDVYTPLLAKAGDLVNLDSLYKSLPYASSLNAGQVSLGRWDGNYYSVPYIADLSMLFYNKTLLAKAGLPTTPPRTWSAIVHEANLVHQKIPQDYGSSFAGDTWGWAGFVTLPAIGHTASDNTTLLTGSITDQHANLLHNSALRTLVTDYHTMWTNHDMPASDQTDTGSTIGVDFEHGQVAFEILDYDTVAELQKAHVKFAWGLEGAPQVNGGPPTTFDGGDVLLIPKKAGRSPALAEVVIKWLLSKSAQEKLPTTGFTPVRTDLLTPTYKKDYPYDAVALAAMKAGVVPLTLDYDALFNVSDAPYFTLWYNGVFGKSSNAVQTALAAAQQGFASQLVSAG